MNVKSDDSFPFDTAKGIEEIVNCRVGDNDLSALASIQACFDAQLTYAAESRNGSGVGQYARKLGAFQGMIHASISNSDSP